jgi:hypothetical protein
MFMIVPDILEARISKQASASPSNRKYSFSLTFDTPLIHVPSGVYVPDSDRWPDQFRGIGIRIEDSVCVGDDNPIVLTTEAVKEVSPDPDSILFRQIQKTTFQIVLFLQGRLLI